MRFAVFGYAATLLVFAYALLEREPYDDSYFFKRIAVNFLQHGQLAWNLAEGPVHGLTSQSMGLVAVAITALGPDYTIITTRVFLLACLLVVFALLVHTARGDRGVCAAYASCSPVVLFTALSGMETALALALLALHLRVLYGRREARHWALGPVLVLLVYLTRPDAVLLALPPLVAQAAVQGRRTLLRALLLIGVGLAGIWLTCRLYYGTALPLPFYAKTAALSAYDAHFKQLSALAGSERFGLYVVVALPLAGLAALRRDLVNATLLGSSALHAAYHYGGTIDVMGMHGRFYAPALPLLVVAAARTFEAPGGLRLPRPRLALMLAMGWLLACSLLWAVGALPAARDREPQALYGATAAAGLLLFAAFATDRGALRVACTAGVLAATAAALLVGVPLRGLPPLSDEAYLARHTANVTSFRGLDRLRVCLGDALHVYHSEIGVTGLRFQNGRVSDLAGLMSPHWLFGRTPFDARCKAEKPDAIFLPHKSYRDLNREIAGSECLRGYVRVVERSSSPLFVRADRLDDYTRCPAPRRAP